ncbi:uncharacterized protein LOC107368861 [Tetranychus urticae]|uniref:CIDE-N domain-containing protein n=1 Tax=Tetranychus urticae TaxID=32264 RepID=T1KZJ4_TETUR|nr:uncharacterized protein LOC107368861 [Tetranychus urticae]XP_015792237.1 uncharacterized protein LOC107368861 [Tetranychus urticae]
MHSNEKPYKVWSCDRELRKAVIASSLEELKSIGASKLGYSYDDPNQLKIVLESDGTEIEDNQYFKLADQETIFLLLRQNEKWIPAGVEALKSAISAFPGNVTVVLQLDNRDPGILLKKGEPPWKLEVVSVSDSRANKFDNQAQTPGQQQTTTSHGPLSSLVLSSSPSTGTETGISIIPRSTLMVQPVQNGFNSSSLSSSSRRANLTLDGLKLRSTANGQTTTHRVKTTTNTTLPSKKLIPGLEDEVEEGEEDEDDEDDINVGEGLGKENEEDVSEESDQGDVTIVQGEVSPNHDHSQCDFHCAALHRGGGEIRVSRSVATSPITESPTPSGLLLSPVSINVPIISGSHSISSNKPRQALKGHVRFMDTEHTNGVVDHKEANKLQTNTATTLNSSVNNIFQGNTTSQVNGNGSDSETETTERDDEQFSERYLLLVDQLSLNQDRHLNLKDIGIILERLSSKIIDVDKLEREKEGSDCYNWIIKATIRGEVLREIGVIYNGQYYGIMEHPGYF